MDDRIDEASWPQWLRDAVYTARAQTRANAIGMQRQVELERKIWAEIAAERAKAEPGEARDA